MRSRRTVTGTARAGSGRAAWVVLVLIVLGLAAYAAVELGVLDFGDPVVVTGSGRRLSPEELSGPVHVSVRAVRIAPTVLFRLHLADADGGEIRSIRLSGARRPKPPAITITDVRGNVVHRATLEYG